MKMLVLLFVLVGCASTDRSNQLLVGVNSVTEVESSGKKVYVVSGTDEVSDTDLLFKKFAKLTYSSLASQGYVPVYTFKEAELVVFLSYEVSDPKNYTQTRNVPIFGGNSTTAVHNQAGAQIGTLRTQNFQPTGYRQDTVNYTIYNRKITLHVYEASKANAEDRNEHLVWGMIINSNGPSPELTAIFPHLLVVGAPFFGKPLSGQITESINLDDARVTALRKPASP